MEPSIPPFTLEASKAGAEIIKTIEMHTTGEPTRIVYSGYPELTGTLLEQRCEAQSKYDHIRKRLIYEPRGHREMYGAVLRTHTELVETGEAHIGVLFLTNDGYSTMCGHAVLAIARLLVDCIGSGSTSIALSGKSQLKFDQEREEVQVRLHVPCGIVHVSVPSVSTPGSKGGCFKSDVTKPTSYLSVPSYATGIWVTVPIPDDLRWPELGERDSVVVDIAYGGAFYIIASPAALGLLNSLATPDFVGLSTATSKLKEAFNRSEQLRKFYLQHAEHADLQFLYGTIVTDSNLGIPAEGTIGAETSLCFFSSSQVDRSPTGSGVQAKVALAYAKGRRRLNERFTYHSIVSNAYNGEGAFIGEAVEEVNAGGKPAVIVKVSGWARYTGACTFVLEDGDGIGEGFWMEAI